MVCIHKRIVHLNIETCRDGTINVIDRSPITSSCTSELFLITVPLTLSNVRITCILVVIVTGHRSQVIGIHQLTNDSITWLVIVSSNHVLDLRTSGHFLETKEQVTFCFTIASCSIKDKSIS